MSKGQQFSFFFFRSYLILKIFIIRSLQKIALFLPTGILVVILPLELGCGKTTTQKRSKSFSAITSCSDSAFEPRKGICVRTEDQCPQYSVKSDKSCKQLPCSPGLYFDGFFCLLQKPNLNFDESVGLHAADLKSGSLDTDLDSEILFENQSPISSTTDGDVKKQYVTPTPLDNSDSPPTSSLINLSLLAGSFVESCLANLTNDQKIGFLAIFSVAEKFLDPKVVVRKTWEMRCLESYSYLSRMRTSHLHLNFADITDVSPLGVFEYLPKIEKIVFSVSPSTIMSCPLADPNRCIFVAWR